MKKIKEAIEYNENITKNFRETMGGKYGKISDNQDIMIMLRAIMYDIERVTEMLREAKAER